MLKLACCLLAALATAGAAVKLELRGRTEPPLARAAVALHGDEFPYEAHTFCGSDGRFRFKGLKPGAYTVILFAPGLGQIRHTVEVSPGLADQKGRVSATIPVKGTGESVKSLEEQGTVSVRALSIPASARSEFDKAQASLNRPDVAGAIEHLQRAVKLAPAFVDAWNNLGTIAYQSGEYATAEKYFREALKHDPGAFWPVVNLGGTLLSMHRFQEALEYNKYAVTQRPGDPLANSQTGRNYFYLGDDDTALKYLTAAKRIDPNHFSYPQVFLAEIYAHRGQTAKAIQELEDFLARHPDSTFAGKARERLEGLRQGQKR